MDKTSESKKTPESRLGRDTQQLRQTRQYPPSTTGLENKARDLGSQLDALLSSHVQELEQQIEACAMVLRVSQPPYEGKYDVRWWVTGQAKDGRNPVLVRWMKGRTDRLEPKPVKALGKQTVRSDGIFAINHDQTQATLKQISALIAQRDELKDVLRYKVGPLVKMLQARRQEHRDGMQRLRDIMQEAVAQLRREGYVGVFPPEYARHFPFLAAQKLDLGQDWPLGMGDIDDDGHPDL